ncbi:DUF6081 family protein [Rhodococcus sp. JVH1]|uniref:DUF6081 family protein n=1 Tax=Rhodococcus sp. JVH1 TaxID=745408 RepID=UPI0002721350|nr:DUF6081 family protein [Rhodococcus sp. JVH1]EJI95750.1 hypothetical protein JVH1_6771 [Rhodococcus sp. JVH1]
MTNTSTSSSVVYDDFSGPELDTAKWTFLEYPFPNVHLCAEPNAQVAVGNGAYSVRIERFENEHGVQIIDNPKHLVYSKTTFPLPDHGVASFSVKMAAQGIGTAPFDYRDGFAAFNVLDLVNGWVFDLAASSEHIFAIHERLHLPGVHNPFTHCVEAPLSGLDSTPGREHTYTISLDTAAGAVTWEVDGRTVYHLPGAILPSQVQVGFGIFTLHPVVNERSVSLHGQGFDVTWRDLRIDMTGTAR